VLANRGTFEAEFRVRRADGEYRWILERASPRFLPDSGYLGYVGIAVDLTDIRRGYDRALRAQNLENLRVLSAGIAHDFNTLIAAIIGEVDLAVSDMLPDTPGLENIQRIDAVAKRAAGIVRLLVAYVGERSDAEPPRDLVDLNSVVLELVPHLKPSLLKWAEIRTVLAKRVPSVMGNLQQLRQVVLNLILNAVEALEGRKGVVTLTTATYEITAKSTGTRPEGLADGLYLRLEVSDTGSGISQQVHSHIFDPYYSTKQLGRGLGLAAVKGIVVSHGGAITARSTPGQGSIFEVLLPVSAAAPAGGQSGRQSYSG
jgi:signal transduction histidine kinase